jgi:mannosyltransferase OCH1-like enzyme
MNIPKIIHYCWFGPNPIPELEQKCLESWNKYLPDYKFIFWNESNFDINCVTYVKQAYEAKKYAFVSDYVRMYALYSYGGIYFDTDLELLSNLNSFLTDEVFLGFENRTMIAAGAIGSVKAHSLFRNMLDYYNNSIFIDSNGNMDTTTVVQILTKFLLQIGFKQQNTEQVIVGIHIYERDVFYPKMITNNKFDLTKRSVGIHYGSGSWLTEKEKRRGKSSIWRNFFRPVLKKTRILLNITLGENKTKKIEIVLRNKMR